MRAQLLNCVVLTHHLPEKGLRAGDLGTVVEIYEDGVFEVEFMKASGETLALLTLTQKDIRPIAGADILSVRSVLNAAA